jgi:hypothetical protein
MKWNYLRRFKISDFSVSKDELPWHIQNTQPIFRRIKARIIVRRPRRLHDLSGLYMKIHLVNESSNVTNSFQPTTGGEVFIS